MARTPPDLAWVICHAQVRVVVRRGVACPARGRVPGIECLGCRYLMTSSAERSLAGWCEAAGPLDAILLGRALQRSAVQLQPDQLAAGLQRVAAPRQPAVLEQGVDRLVAGQHRRFQGHQPAAASGGDAGVQQASAEATPAPLVGNRDRHFLGPRVALGVQGLKAQVADHPVEAADREQPVPAPLSGAGEAIGLGVADLAAGAEEARAPAFGAERGVERGNRRTVPGPDVAEARSGGVHLVSIGPGRSRRRVPFALPRDADRSAPVGPSVTHG